MYTFINNPNTSKFVCRLSTIPEEKEMVFPTIKCIDWSNKIEQVNQPIKCSNIMNHYLEPIVCDWISPTIEDFEDEESYDFYREETEYIQSQEYENDDYESYQNDEDTSIFLNPMGETVCFNQYDFVQKIHEQKCSSCLSIQPDNVLYQICHNEHFFCSECLYQEKMQSQRQNTEWQRQKRNNNNPTISHYEFTCPTCNTCEKLNFNVMIDYNQENEEVEIIIAHK